MDNTLADRLNSVLEDGPGRIQSGKTNEDKSASSDLVLNNDSSDLDLIENSTKENFEADNINETEDKVCDNEDQELEDGAEKLPGESLETNVENSKLVPGDIGDSDDRTKKESAINENCDKDMIENSTKEGSETKGDNFEDNKEDEDKDEFADFSEESGSDAEYESAEEGEEIHTDKQNLKELEETLTEEEKEERRGTAQEMKEEGNELFRCGSYKSAIRIYSRALRTCPLKYAKDRAIMYSNRGACKMRLEEYEDSIKDCSKALELHPHYMKALMRRAELYEKTEKLDEALTDYQKILEIDPSQHTARAACIKLPEQIKERNEKLKEEMMSKLKDLGNMVLRPFGLSTNNFKMQQDPNTGGYSVNFVQKPDEN